MAVSFLEKNPICRIRNLLEVSFSMNKKRVKHVTSDGLGSVCEQNLALIKLNWFKI